MANINTTTSSPACICDNDNAVDIDDFSDTRVILLPKSDSRVCFRNSECYVEQSFDSPIYVAIGARASDEQLAKVSARHCIPMTDLRLFRAAMGADNLAAAA